MPINSIVTKMSFKKTGKISSREILVTVFPVPKKKITVTQDPEEVPPYPKKRKLASRNIGKTSRTQKKSVHQFSKPLPLTTIHSNHQYFKLSPSTRTSQETQIFQPVTVDETSPSTAFFENSTVQPNTLDTRILKRHQYLNLIPSLNQIKWNLLIKL